MQSAMIWFNGEVLEQEAFRLSPFSRGLHYGDGVFETMRSYGGRVFRLHNHLSRLKRGMEILGIQSDDNQKTL